MKDDEFPQAAAPCPAAADDQNLTALPWSVAVDGGSDVGGGEARPALPRHGGTERPIAANHGHGDELSGTPPTNPFVKPNDETRSDAAEHTNDGGMNAAGRGQLVSEDGNSEQRVEARPVVPDHGAMAVDDVSTTHEETEQPVGDNQVGEDATDKIVPPVVPPNSADLVTVEEAVAIFSQRGLPRHMRTIQKYCSRRSGRALVCYQVPTENGIRYMIERSSIDRFIGDAAQQAPTGKLESEPVAAQASEREAAPTAVADAAGIFDHPFVQRLEAQVERLESRNEHLQREIQNVLTDANERLVELQKANAVAQSESLGTFLLEAERIRRRQEAPNDVSEAPLAATPPVNREGRQFGTFDV